MQEADTDFEQVTADDYPEEKPHETFTVTKDTEDGELEVKIEFRDGLISVGGSGAYSFFRRGNLTREDGHSALHIGVVSLGDKRTNLTIAIPEEVHERLDELQEEHEEWEEEAKGWIVRQPLRFRAEEHDYKMGAWRTKYSQSAVVMKANKHESYMTDLEQTLYKAMRDVYGVADGYPEAPDDFDGGDVVSRREVAVGEVKERWRELMAELEEKERWQELVAEHPSLRDTSATSSEVEKAFREAERDGERKKITAKSTSCSEPSYECNLDNIVLYATPDHEIETDRIHTH